MVATKKIDDKAATTAKIADNAVDADKLNVDGNGSSGNLPILMVIYFI